MPIQFQLLRIEVPQFAILANKPVNGPFRVNFDINFATSKERVIKCTFKIVYLKEAELVTQLVVDTIFSIAEESWEEMKKDGKIVIPTGFLQHLAVISLGTARGIQYAKTEAAGLNNDLIPLINLTEIITSDLVVPKE